MLDFYIFVCAVTLLHDFSIVESHWMSISRYCYSKAFWRRWRFWKVVYMVDFFELKIRSFASVSDETEVFVNFIAEFKSICFKKNNSRRWIQYCSREPVIKSLWERDDCSYLANVKCLKLLPATFSRFIRSLKIGKKLKTWKRICLFLSFYFLIWIEKGRENQKSKDLAEWKDELAFLLPQNVDLELGGGNLSDFDSYMSVYWSI